MRLRPVLLGSLLLLGLGLLTASITLHSQLNTTPHTKALYAHIPSNYSQQFNHSLDCSIRKQMPPLPYDNNPHVYDLFAADNLTRLFFITQRYYGRCAPKELSPIENRKFLGQLFICEFATTNSEERFYSISKRTYKKDAYFSTTIISCVIPEQLRALADNAENKAQLKVSLIPTHNMHPEQPLIPLQNLPVCANPVVNRNEIFDRKNHKQHYLAGCIWTTGDTYLRVDDVTLKKSNISDILPRIKEWITFHRMVGFEHFYIYDNSEKPHGPLWEVLLPYIRQGLVTYIHWPPKVCYRHRSSQYAAENSCIRRFGQFNTWMAHFDVDEYLTPLGKFRDIPSILRKYEHDDSVDSVGFNDHIYGLCADESADHDPSKLFLHERSCFSGKRVPFKRKEVVKPSHVYYHWVHYTEALWDDSRKPRAVLLDDSSEAKMTHTRWGVRSGRSRDPDDPVVNVWVPLLNQAISTER
jgi:hypothetical protein